MRYIKKNSVWASVLNSIQRSRSVRDSVRVWDCAYDSVEKPVWDSVNDSVGNSVRDSVWHSVRDAIDNSVVRSVWEPVACSIEDQLWDTR